MKKYQRHIVFCFSVVAAGAVAWRARAGDLNPPAGPVAPSMKTLAEVEPRIAVNATNTPGDADSLFVISQPGAYYLTGNVAGGAGRNGIKITSGGVTLDLMGFTLQGIAGSLSGVFVDTTASALSNITILNGTVSGWGQHGVITYNPAGGFISEGVRVEGILASGNGSNGITVGRRSLVSNCVARANAGSGINAGDDSITEKCVAQGNTSVGLVVFGGIARHCISRGNASDGIRVTSGIVEHCNVNSNTGPGISIMGSGAIVRFNSCIENGFLAGVGAGISQFVGSGSRIEGNHVQNNDTGIHVTVGGNFITRNICRGNTQNWNIAAGNVCLVVSASTNAAFSGNSGGTAPGSTDPNANFTH
jgi:parallel beta-helix repeat protein